MRGQYFAQAGTLLGISRDAKVHLDDVRHVDERLVAWEQNKVVERNLVARILQVTYGFENLGGRLHCLKNLHDNAVVGQEFRCTHQEILLCEIDECLAVGDKFFHAKIEHGIDHDTLCCHISVEIGVIGVFQTAAKKNLVCIDTLLLIEDRLTSDKCVCHWETFLYLCIVYRHVNHQFYIHIISALYEIIS